MAFLDSTSGIQAKSVGHESQARTALLEIRDHVAGWAAGKVYGAADGTTDDAAALQAAINSGASIIDLGGLTYRITAGLTLPAGQQLRNGTLAAWEIASGAAVTVTASGSGATPSRPVLERLTIQLHSAPADGVHSATTDGVNFQTLNVATRHLTVTGARYGVTYDSNSWSVTHHDPAFWYCGRGVSADANGKTNMGAGLRFHHPDFAHCDYAVYNRLCEVTMIDPSFDSAVLGYVEDNITDSAGYHNSEMVLVNPRFEAGGNASYPWVKNSGNMTLRNVCLFAPATYSYLFDNSGLLTVDGGFSRVVGDAYTSRNTGSGITTVRGIKLIDRSGPMLRLSRSESRVFNGGLERGDTVGFGISGGTGAIAAVGAVPTPYAGSFCLKITNGAASVSTFRSSAVPVAPTGTMHLSVMYQNLGADQGALHFEFYSADGVVLEDTAFEYLNVNATWTRLVHVQAIPSGSAYFRMRIDLADSETLAFDEFYLSEW